MIYSYYNHEEDLLTVKPFGENTLEDMLSAIQRTREMASRVLRLKILEDAGEGRITLTPPDITILFASLQEVAGLFDHVKHAVVHTHPRYTALAMMVSEQLDPVRYHMKVFSDNRSAKEWLFAKT